MMSRTEKIAKYCEDLFPKPILPEATLAEATLNCSPRFKKEPSSAFDYWKMMISRSL